MIVVVYGLPGTGKTTVGSQLAESLGCPLLRTDVLRKKIITQPRYTPEEKTLVYRLVRTVTEVLLQQGIDVVVDGAYSTHAPRVELAEVAAAAGVPIHFAECFCDELVAAGRIGTRTDRASDASVATYRELRAEWEDNTYPHLPVDTCQSVADNVAAIRRFVAAGAA